MPGPAGVQYDGVWFAMRGAKNQQSAGVVVDDKTTKVQTVMKDRTSVTPMGHCNVCNTTHDIYWERNTRMNPMNVALLGAIAGAVLIAPAAQADEALAKKHNCMACHQVDKKLVGPSYKDVANKYRGQKDAAAKLAEKVKKGGQGVWGPVPMPPNAAVSDADIKTLVNWVLSLK